MFTDFKYFIKTMLETNGNPNPGMQRSDAKTQNYSDIRNCLKSCRQEVVLTYCQIEVKAAKLSVVPRL